jgi:hypothetical protein
MGVLRLEDPRMDRVDTALNRVMGVSRPWLLVMSSAAAGAGSFYGW